MTDREVLYVVEGRSDIGVARRIINDVGRTPRELFVAQGAHELDRRIPKWRQPSNTKAILVLRDLDSHPCAPKLVSLLSGPGPLSETVCLRIAVREMEAWLLGDRPGAAEFFGLRARSLPEAPDELADPKQQLVDLCRASRRRSIREGIAPRAGAGRSVGPEYVALVNEYCQSSWSPSRARKTSPSLERALSRIESLVASGLW